jgi:VCBS repeat-containing protein
MTEGQLAAMPGQRCGGTPIWGFGAKFLDNLKSGTVNVTPTGQCDGSTMSCSYRINAVDPSPAPGSPDPLPAWLSIGLQLSWARYDDGQPVGHRIVLDRATVDAPFWVVRTAGPPPPNTTPTASFTWAERAGDPSTIDFDASGSSDPNGQIVDWQWDFGDQQNGTGETPSHTYTESGDHTVTLTVTDNDGNKNSTAQIVGRGLAVSIDAPTAVKLGETFTLRISATNKRSSDVTNVHPAFDPVTRGQGDLELISGPAPASVDTLAPDAEAVFTYTYKASRIGAVQVVATVLGADAQTQRNIQGGDTADLVVEDAALSVKLAVSPQTAKTGETVTATVTARNDGVGEIRNLTPTSFAATPDKGISLQGPAPTSHAILAPGAEADFVYTLTADSPGNYDLLANVEGERDGPNGTETVPGAASASFEAKLDPTFSAKDDHGDLGHVKVSAPVSFEGAGWDPNGGSIEVVWNSNVVATLPAGKTISGEFDAPDYPPFVEGDPEDKRCATTVTARQDGVERDLPVHGRAAEAVLFARNVFYENGDPVPSKSTACEGQVLFSSDGTPFLGENSPPYVAADNICGRSEPATLITLAALSGRPTSAGKDRQIQRYSSMWIQHLSSTGQCFDVRGVQANRTYIADIGLVLNLNWGALLTPRAEIRGSLIDREQQPNQPVIVAQELLILYGPGPVGNRDWDGIADAIDGTTNSPFVDQSDSYSDNFTDKHLGGSTSGSVDRGGLLLAVDRDGDGIRVAASGEETDQDGNPVGSTVDACQFGLGFTAGDDATLQCGSLHLDVHTGPVEVALDDSSKLVVPGGTEATVRRVSATEVEVEVAAGSAAAAVVDRNGQTSQIAPGQTAKVGGLTLPNDAPQCSGASEVTPEDTALQRNASCADANGDTLTYSKASDPAHGSVVVQADGRFTYTPAKDFNGSDSFEVAASDGRLASAPATVKVTVTSVNDKPVCQAKSLQATVGQTAQLQADCADADGDPLSYAIASQGTKGGASVSGQTISYTPTQAGSDSFTYTATDGTLTSDPATVSVTNTSTGASLTIAIERGLVVFKKKPDDDRARFEGTYTSSQPLACGEDVTVALDGSVFKQTVPGQAFEVKNRGKRCLYVREKGEGGIKRLELDLAKHTFLVKLRDEVELSALTNPVTLALTIGTQTASETIAMKQEKHRWTYQS